MDKEQQIREMAYHLWVDEGRPHGRHEEHWRQASKLVAQGANGPAAPKRAAAKRTGNGGRMSGTRTAASFRKATSPKD
jgi:Protein of unknown function (DUF2934)